MIRTMIAAAAAAAAVLTLGLTGTASAHPGGHGHGHDCDGHVGRGHHECPPPPVEPPTPPVTETPNLFNLIVGTRGRDRLPGTSARDAIFALAGNDVLIGRNNRDRLYGMGGNDRLRGGAFDGDRDVMNGGRGSDLCIGGTEDVYRSCERRIVV